MPGYCIRKRLEKIYRDKIFLLQLAIELAADYQEAREEQIRITNTKRISTLILRQILINIKQIKYYKDNKIKICSKCKKYVCGKCTLEPPCICKKCGPQSITY